MVRSWFRHRIFMAEIQNVSVASLAYVGLPTDMG